MVDVDPDELANGATLPLVSGLLASSIEVGTTTSPASTNNTRKDGEAINPLPLDAMDIDEDDQATSNLNSQTSLMPLDSYLRGTPDDILVHFIDTIMKNDEKMARETIEQAKQQSYPILGSWSSNSFVSSILTTSQARIQTTPLGVYEVKSPVLFAIACSCEPNLIRLLFENGLGVATIPWRSEPDRTETILHALARLPPEEALGILSRIKDVARFKYWRRYENYTSPHTPLEVAKLTAQKCEPQDYSFFDALDLFTRVDVGKLV